MKITHFLLFLSLFCQLKAQQNPVFTHIDTRDGLSDNRVLTISQMKDGRMVFLTEGLVNIYDGTGFRYWHYNDAKAFLVPNYSGFHRIYLDNENYMWIKNHGKMICFDLTTEKFIENTDSLFQISGISEKISDYIVDSECNHWYLTENNSLFNRKSGEKTARLFIGNVSVTGSADDKFCDLEVRDSLVFVFFKSGLMNCYNLNGKTLLYQANPYEKTGNPYTANLKIVPYKNYLYQLRNSYRDLGSVVRFNISERAWETVFESTWQNALTVDNDGVCRVSSPRGIRSIDETLNENNLISEFQMADGRIIETEISTQYKDSQGGLWLGTVNRGLLYYHPDRFKFRKFGPSFFETSNGNGLNFNCFGYNNGDILIGTSRGLFVFSGNENGLSRFPEIPTDVICNTIFQDSKARIWLSTNNYGVYCIQGSHSQHFKMPFNCQSVFENEEGTLYLTTVRGFGEFNPVTGKYTLIKQSAGLGHIFELMSYEDGKMLGVLYGDAGLFVFDYRNDTITFPGKEDSFLVHSNNKYHDIFKDSRGLLWFGTQDGLNVYNPESKTTRVFFETDGLINNNIRSVAEDDKGNIWVSASYGISCIRIASSGNDYSYSFTGFNQFDGVLENEFLPRSVLKTEDGRLFWGGVEGFNEYDMKGSFPIKNELSVPIFTGFFISGKEVRIGERFENDVIIEKSLIYTDKIVLKHFQNFIGFRFTSVNYVNPAQSRYLYQLEGVDNGWKELRSENGSGYVSYTNLRHGTYNFKVMTVDGDGLQTNNYAEMNIVIKPSFLNTHLAYFIYSFLALGTCSLLVYTYMKSSRKKIVARHNKELEEMKMSFYTNISHELRTPLSLIITPLNSIIRKQKNDDLKSQLSVIYRNARDLLNLVNQLLDFRKLDLNGENFRPGYCQVDEFLKEIIESFSETAAEKEIKLSFSAENTPVQGFVDRDKLRKIVYNLLSNALKFTQKGGSVSLSVSKPSGESIVIKVSDNGPGIPEKDLPEIFNRFYQGNNDGKFPGSGIGLYLVKQYTQMHDGIVRVETNPDQGSTFIVEIPDSLKKWEDIAEKTSNRKKSSGIKILLIEDNTDFRNYLGHELSEYYEVITASNGREGLVKAREQQPNLIISDIMMPEMSGIELCSQVKNDILVSHIPVVLLSAKSSDEVQSEGFRAGADAYVTKPFNMEILHLRIENLIEQQNRRRKIFKTELYISPDSLSISSLDEVFIKNTLEQINKNIANPSYSVDQLSKEMCLDRTGLYRKIKAITGQTPSELIRSVKIKRAAQLLKLGFPVAEVVEKVGFASSSYFARCFQEEFKCKPSQYRNQSGE